ncbi:MAG: hypothetical protein AAF353_06140 [Pseudomonadota bacterium]
MAREASTSKTTLALNTNLEREFVSPLTSIRGVLEIIRDYQDLSVEERNRFLTNALQDCTRLESGIEHLASRVYAAAEPEDTDKAQLNYDYSDRIRFDERLNIVDIDFSDFEFNNSGVVNHFYDELDQRIEQSGKRWYFVVNYRRCTVWPEAWVAFAHRGSKVNASYSLGTIRYIEPVDGDEADSALLSDPDVLDSRDAALMQVENWRQSKS